MERLFMKIVMKITKNYDGKIIESDSELEAKIFRDQ